MHDFAPGSIGSVPPVGATGLRSVLQDLNHSARAASRLVMDYADRMEENGHPEFQRWLRELYAAVSFVR